MYTLIWGVSYDFTDYDFKQVLDCLIQYISYQRGNTPGFLLNFKFVSQQ